MGKIFIYLLSKGEGAGKVERDGLIWDGKDGKSGFEPGLNG